MHIALFTIPSSFSFEDLRLGTERVSVVATVCLFLLLAGCQETLALEPIVLDLVNCAKCDAHPHPFIPGTPAAFAVAVQ